MLSGYMIAAPEAGPEKIVNTIFAGRTFSGLIILLTAREGLPHPRQALSCSLWLKE